MSSKKSYKRGLYFIDKRKEAKKRGLLYVTQIFGSEMALPSGKIALIAMSNS